ncbi:MAG: hypothetical protein QMD22_05930, partial [archaeon]|nr:hypothetical protein [archaeon]
VAIPMLNTTKDILGDEMETVVFDKWFSVGSLLDYIDKEMGIKYVTLLKLFQNSQRSYLPECRQTAGNRAEQNLSNACDKTRGLLHCKLLKKRYWRRLR